MNEQKRMVEYFYAFLGFPHFILIVKLVQGVSLSK